MINQNHNEFSQITSKAYLEEILILKRKIEKQEGWIKKLAQKADIKLSP